MIQQLLDKRKLVRAVDLIKSDDPDKAAASLQTALNEALVAYSSGNTRLQRSALNEIKNLKNAMLAQQIDAGAKTSNYTVAFSTLIDKFEKEVDFTTQQNSSVSETIKTLAGNLPSVDTLTTALITANPLVGYGVKMISDISGRAKSKFNSAKMEEMERKRKLEEEANSIKSLLDSVEQQSEQVAEIAHEQDASNKRNYKTLSSTLDKKFEDNTSSIFEQIANNTLALVKIWDENFDLSKTEDVLEKIVDIEEERNGLIKEQMNQAEIDAIEAERRANEPTVIVPDKDTKKQKPIDQSDILAGVGMGFGLQGMKDALGSFKKLFGFFGSITKVLKVAGKFAVVTAVISGVVDLIDGFYSAGKYFDDEIGIKERLISAVASFTSGIVSMVDWVAGLVGLNFLDENMSEEQLTKKIVDSIVETIDSVINFFTSIIDTVDQFIEDSKNFVSDSIKSFFGIGDDEPAYKRTRGARVSASEELNSNQVDTSTPSISNTVIAPSTTNILGGSSQSSFIPATTTNSESAVREIRSRSNARRIRN